MTSDPIIDALIDEVPVFGASSPRASPWRWIAEGTVGHPIIPFETRSQLGQKFGILGIKPRSYADKNWVLRLNLLGQVRTKNGQIWPTLSSETNFCGAKIDKLFVSLFPVRVQMR